MGCGRSRIESSTFPKEVQQRPIQVEVMFGSNIRSPGKTSPTGVIGAREGPGVGRTMKEYEDQLQALKKENFNLKLRIYFLEERMGITSADENAIQKNIELKVEIESLRKELVEKQELLSQAAKALELIEEQKEASSRNQAQYQQSLEAEREKIRQLEKELEEYRDKVTDASIYYKEAFGITPEEALENEEKLHQMEELVSSLEAEVKQVTNSLEEERVWAQELESERDEFRNRLEAETRLRENLDAERVSDIEELRGKLKEFEEQLLKRDTLAQQCKIELAEKDRIIKEKSAQLEEKCRALEEATSICEKRKRHVDQLRASIKSRDEIITDLNNKHRNLLSQSENGNAKRSPPSSPSGLNNLQDPLQLRMGQKLTFTTTQVASRGSSMHLDLEPNKDRSSKLSSPSEASSGEARESKDLLKELEERDTEKKQLVLKLCNAQQRAEVNEQKLKELEGKHEKAIKAIQGFIGRQQQLESAKAKKEQRIKELEDELARLRNLDNQKLCRNGHSGSYARNEFATDIASDPERDHGNQEMQERLNDRDQKIEVLKSERITMKEELDGKTTELAKLKEAVQTKDDTERVTSPNDRDELIRQLGQRQAEIDDKNRKIEQLSKELQVKTQNLQKLVNTELWSKNKEIAKLHNHMTATYSHERNRNKSDVVQDVGTHTSSLVKELNDIGIRVTLTNDVIQLNYVEGDETLDITTLAHHIQKLVSQRSELEKEVDYLKWLKLVAKPDVQVENDEYAGNEIERAKKYCELLRTHLKDLVRFMKEMLKNQDHTDTIGNRHKKIVLDVLLNSKILSDDFANALESMSANDLLVDVDNDEVQASVVKCRTESLLGIAKNQTSTPSDSEAFSEPDRTVSLARIGLQEPQQKSANRPRFSKYSKDFTDSEDSLEYVPYYKTYQNDLNDSDASQHLQELKETNALIYTELNALRKDLVLKIPLDEDFEDRLTPLFVKLEKSQRFCDRLQSVLEKRVHEFHTLKRESKQNNIRKTQLEKKLADVETMAAEVTKQKAELMHYKETADRKATEMLITLTRENDTLKARIKKLEDEYEAAKSNVSTLTKELDHLTLLHSQMLVENTKLTNDKLRLEQDFRKTEGRYDASVRSLHDKYNKEISDLNQINDSQRVRLQELEVANKELRRHVTVCDASDSAPSSSGVSSIPADAVLKQSCDDIMQEYQVYNNSQYWLPTYPIIGGRSKSSCSPDLGIESDAAVTTIRPLKDTLKITESMTNLLSDDDNGNTNQPVRDIDTDSPLPIEGADEIEALKQENEVLKRKLMKTKRALEDTFQHLSASNKNKKNVEKAITKQLQITKNILKKTRTFEEPLDN